MKRMMVALLCAALLCVCLSPLTASATEDYYFIAFNDDLPESFTVQNTPIRIGGITYVPINVFDSRQDGGKSLGLFSGQDSDQGTITIYNKSDMLVFDVNAGTAYGRGTGLVYEYKAVYRNGLMYVPVADVCRYFGMTCSFLSTNYGPLIRVKDGNEIIKDDGWFLSSIAAMLEGRLTGATTPSTPPSNPNGGNNGNTTPNPPPEEEPTTPKEEMPDVPEVGTGQDIYLAIRVTDGRNYSNLMTVLRQYQIKALFFFQVESLAQQDDLIRQAVGEGHRIGLVPQGTTAQELEESLAQGNEMLEHIIRQKSSFVLPGDDVEVRDALREKGWICWIANVSVSSEEGSASWLYETVTAQVEASTTGTRLLLDEGTPSGTLSSILRNLQEKNSVFHVIRETDY